jgi:hypothetical protein
LARQATRRTSRGSPSRGERFDRCAVRLRTVGARVCLVPCHATRRGKEVRLSVTGCGGTGKQVAGQGIDHPLDLGLLVAKSRHEGTGVGSRAPAKNAHDDAALASALAATAHPHLSRIDADPIYIALGIGETFAAIDALLTVLARNHIPLSAELGATAASWLDCYPGHDAEPRLRQLLAEIKAVSPQQISGARNQPGSGRTQRGTGSGDPAKRSLPQPPDPPERAGTSDGQCRERCKDLVGDMGTTTSPNFDVVYLTPTFRTLPTRSRQMGCFLTDDRCREPHNLLPRRGFGDGSTQAKRMMQMVPASRL